ncbi:hypothetical protein TAMA11512_02630 [Selenomonas sp. TAMA-11512]|uniref:metal-dependent hydrolase n=1 Tax=Selenomonas sp. TAMA-11512 TaxID=3095337 RepID=UPI0030873B92|nr:hypothetical protein TAMA11512_02630 [Selenomonas sp. TAMA-11512]
MKWLNHQIVTGVAVYSFTDDLLLTAVSMAGAVLPDWLEGKPGEGRSYMKWRSRHRGWSHWALLYVFLYIVLTSYAETGGAGGVPGELDIFLLLRFFLFGALLHIAEDALCGKVPLLRPQDKVGLRLFRVGSVREYLVSLAIVLGCFLAGMMLRG